MKKLNILASLFMGLAFFTACEDQDNSPILQEPTSFTLNTPAFVNTVYDLENSTSLELTWSQPDYGFTAATSYTVEVSLTGEWGEGKSTILGGVYNQAKINIDAAELASTLTTLANKSEADFPFITEVYFRLKASLTQSGKGEVYSNTITLPNVRLYYALPPVNAPNAIYLIGQCNGWDWSKAYQLIDTFDNAEANGNDGQSKVFWRIVYLPAEGGLKFNSNKSWDGGEVGYAGVTSTDNANAGIKASDDGNIVVTNGGWYLVVARLSVSGRNIVYNIEFNKPNVYLMGSNAPVNDWTINEANLFTVPSDADGDFVSPAFAYNTDGDGGVRACVSIEGCDWWKTEFMVFNGELKYRATGGDQERVNGTKGQVLYINFTKGTGDIK